MSHFAEVQDGIVQNVIVAEQDFIDSGAVGDSSNWIQTSYNTRSGVHYAPNSNISDSGIALHKNYAGVGFIYDSIRNAFYSPQPYPSWLLDDDTCQWKAPTPMPDDGKRYDWDEPTTSWIERVTNLP
jgi:hypothetical protein